jgi:hypothetical protein
MNCRQFKRFVDARPLRERSESELQQARHHAARCARCGAYLDGALRLESGLADLSPIVSSASFSEAVMSRVTRLSRRPAHRPTQLRIETAGLLAASIAAIALGAGWLCRQGLGSSIDTVKSLPGAATATATAWAEHIQPATWQQRLSALSEDAASSAAAVFHRFGPGRCLEAVWHFPREFRTDTIQQAINDPSNLLTWGSMLGMVLLVLAVWLYDRRSVQVRGSQTSQPADKGDPFA